MNKVKGLIFGLALGDSVGMPYENKFKDEIENVEFPYKYRERSWEINDWTEDTDITILVMENIIEKGNATNFAKKLIQWKESGFKELNDSRGLGLESLTDKVIMDGSFEDNPYNSSYQVWNDADRVLAGNGSLIRSSVLFMFNEDVIKKYCRLTHYDGRCVIACLILCKLLKCIYENNIISIEEILQYAINKCRDRDIYENLPKSLISKGKNISNNFITSYQFEGDYLLEEEIKDIFINSLDLSKLNLDNHRLSIGYVFKTLGCALYTYNIIYIFHHQHRELDFKKVIYDIIEQGGDTDTNAAIAGALLGCYLSFENLPKDWIELTPHNIWLLNKTDNFLKFINH